MQFDLVTILGLGAVVLAAILVRQHLRGGSAGEEDDRFVDQQRDVFRALKSMRKD